MKDLMVGQMINVAGMEAKIVGIIRMPTYIDLRLKAGGKTFSLDNCLGGRLWRKTDVSIDIREILDRPAQELVKLVGEKLPGLPNVVVMAAGCEEVQGAKGRVEGTKKGDAVFYIEGESLDEREFKFFAIQIWGNEPPEVEEGKLVDFF
jgi:hypothetical protein